MAHGKYIVESDSILLTLLCIEQFYLWQIDIAPLG